MISVDVLNCGNLQSVAHLLKTSHTTLIALFILPTSVYSLLICSLQRDTYDAVEECCISDEEHTDNPDTSIGFSGSMFISNDGSDVEEKFSSQMELRYLNDYLQACGKGTVTSMTKPWEESSDRSRRRHLNEARETVLSVLQTLAPHSVGQLWNTLKSSDLEDQDSEPSTADRKLVDALAECYLNATKWSTRRQILSIMSDKLQFKEIKKLLPEVTRYRFAVARQHRILHGRGAPVPTKVQTRMKIDPSQLDHFLNFITSPHVTQDLPFGEKTTKLTTGEVLQVPNVIRMMIPSTLIKQYQRFCQETFFKPLSESTLRRILDVCPASTRKSLQGLDYFTADGTFGHLYN